MFQHNKSIYICGANRTAIGSFLGSLSSVSAIDLGAAVIKETLSRTGVPGDAINEVIMGCILSTGTGQAPARQCMIKAGLPNTVQAMTINKVCSSGLKSVMLAANQIELGQADAIIAGGMESMSQAPYFLPAMRSGARMGQTAAEDTILTDGLLDPYSGNHMGNCAELCARERKISREQQDEFALESYRRANAAIEAGAFVDEILTYTIKSRKGDIEVSQDEEPGKVKVDKVPALRPVFEKEGSVTAANASSMNDGASAMLVCSEEFVKQHNLTPLARIVSQGWNAHEPEWFTTAPVGAVQNALKAADKSVSDIDFYEINEAFSVVALAIQGELDIAPEKLNVNGGAVALGHPLGATGARILTTLLHTLQKQNANTGIASLCNGGGEATALMVERA